ncbi:MAG: PH domain-containing protein, partial [Acidobacteria bacterium]|nr:PH domain-containing protein [Acidobacteriota bacterium]
FSLRTPGIVNIVVTLPVSLLLLLMIGGFRYSISRERIRLRWGWARIPLLNLRISDLAEVEVLESGVFRRFGGFGIRYGSLGWGFVLHNKAICLKTHKGRGFAFSAKNPAMTAELIEVARRALKEPVEVSAQISQTGTGIHAIEAPAKPWRRNIPAVIIVLVVITVIYLGYSEPRVAFDSNAFKLKGLYGVDIPLTEITEVDLVTLHEMPAISMRTNGISLSGVRRGNFRTNSGDNIRLSINLGVNPVIRIVDRNGAVYYINRKNPDETRQIFNSIKR